VNRRTPVASRTEVEEFLATTAFDGYQAVALPHGLEVPGIERHGRLNQVLGDRVAGKSVLDVGTNYGVFAYEAVCRGAARAVGLERDAARADVARRICELHGRPYEIRQGAVEDLEDSERFDVVLLLNVLHHLNDPIAVMRRVVSVCREMVIVEFCLPDDPEYLVDLVARRGSGSRAAWWAARGLSRLLRPAVAWLPLMAVGSRPYHRTFYFSERAFRTLFTVHHPLFEHVEVEPSVTGQRRAVAFCQVRRGGDGARSQREGRPHVA